MHARTGALHTQTASSRSSLSFFFLFILSFFFFSFFPSPPPFLLRRAASRHRSTIRHFCVNRRIIAGILALNAHLYLALFFSFRLSAFLVRRCNDAQEMPDKSSDKSQSGLPVEIRRSSENRALRYTGEAFIQVSLCARRRKKKE